MDAAKIIEDLQAALLAATTAIESEAFEVDDAMSRKVDELMAAIGHADKLCDDLMHGRL